MNVDLHQMASTTTALPPAHPAAIDLLPGPGMPQDRHVRVAARRLFIELKQEFQQAVQDLEGERADWLRQQVEQAAEPIDLWLLRGMVYAALLRMGLTSERALRDLQCCVDSAFPDGSQLLPYGTWR